MIHITIDNEAEHSDDVALTASLGPREIEPHNHPRRVYVPAGLRDAPCDALNHAGAITYRKVINSCAAFFARRRIDYLDKHNELALHAGLFGERVQHVGVVPDVID